MAARGSAEYRARGDISVAKRGSKSFTTNQSGRGAQGKTGVRVYLDDDVPKEIYLAKKDALVRSLTALKENAVKQFVQKVGTNPVLEDTSPHFSVAAPFTFAATRRGFLPARPIAALRAATLTSDEVSICGECITFARTHFARAERVVT